MSSGFLFWRQARQFTLSNRWLSALSSPLPLTLPLCGFNWLFQCWKLLRKAEDKANAAQDATTAAEAAKKMSEIAQLHEEALEADPENPDALMRQTSLLEFERDGLTAGCEWPRLAL